MPDLSSRRIFDIVQKSATRRLTWQATRANKLAVLFEQQWRDLGRRTAGRSSPEAFVRYRVPDATQIVLAGWSSPLTNRLLLEARGSHHGEVWLNIGGDDLQSTTGS